MPQPAARKWYFTGTDTDVGKTYVASLAVAEVRHSGHRVAVYKPVASGCQQRGESRVSPDAESLWRSAGEPGDLDAVCPQRFIAPLAPPAAAELEGRHVDEARLVSGLDAVVGDADFVVIEGAGGLLSPLSTGMLNSDLAARFDAELVIVAANRLGTIHQVLATVLAAKTLGLPILGIVLSDVAEPLDPSAASNAATLRRFTSVPLLGQVAHGAIETGIDWCSLAVPQRPPAEVPGDLEAGMTRAWL